MNGTGRPNSRADGHRATAIAITSGKGGVGKTNLATNLGIALAEAGHHACLVDADFGLANVCIILGRQPEHTFDDVLRGETGLLDTIMSGPGGLDILPAASGLDRLVEATPEARGRLPADLKELESRYDYLLIDTSAGISPAVLAFIKASDETAVVITPEPTSLTDAFTLLKALRREHYAGGLNIIVNMLPPEQDGRRLFARFNAAAARHLGLRLNYLGQVVMDRSVTSAVLRQTPLMVHRPDSPASRCLRRIAARITEIFPPAESAGRFSASWVRAVEQLTPPGASAPESEAEPAAPTLSEKPSPAVITPPLEFRNKEPDRQADSLSDLAERVVGLLTEDQTPESTARQFMGRVETAFSRRFRRRTADLRNMLNAALQEQQLTEEQHRELLDMLDNAFEQRFGRPHRDPRKALTSLLEQHLIPQDSALDMARQLVRELAGSPGASAQLVRELLASAYDTDDPQTVTDLREQILDIMGPAAEQPGQSTATTLDAATADLLQDLEKQRHELESRMTELCMLLSNHAGTEKKLSEALRLDSREDRDYPG